MSVDEVSFPPLMVGHRVEGQTDPFDDAIAQASLGCDAGTIVYNLGAHHMSAALVFAPEVPLADAVAMLPVCEVGFQNALGALAPPEVAVHFEWTGAMRINGAKCGGFRMAASAATPDETPDWLAVGFELPLWPQDDDTGHTPDETALYAEGCVEVDAQRLLESWARHSLVWINKWEDEGIRPLHDEWRGLLHGVGEETPSGETFLGLDEKLGMLLRKDSDTRLAPLTDLLETI